LNYINEASIAVVGESRTFVFTPFIATMHFLITKASLSSTENVLPQCEARGGNNNHHIAYKCIFECIKKIALAQRCVPKEQLNGVHDDFACVSIIKTGERFKEVREYV
jgi:hypothetical protein